MTTKKQLQELLHLVPDEFKASIEATEKKTGFFSRLIEKDYYCSLVLSHLYGCENSKSYIFKGGTALNKVHFGFYRLSEDLDFTVSVAPEATRGDRRKARAPFEARLNELPKAFPVFSFSKPWLGANGSTHYSAEFSYASLFQTQPGTISVEVGLREALILNSERRDALCLLMDIFTDRPLLEPVSVQVMNSIEAIAEKSRAALARLKPAIRDVFDLWYAKEKGLLPLKDPAFTDLVRQKLAVPGTGPASASAERREEFRRQLRPDLSPVLRPKDFDRFDFDEGWRIVEELAHLVLAK